ncbi:TetR/AcrR family transcriptional regulator [Ornithinimicrobium sp. Arc0846-15]|nr:TetR/AcrR family transcriptional regulator [Ornithinimicrobium laminariae]
MNHVDINRPEPLGPEVILPPTKRGQRTRANLLAAAESVFATSGYHDASIVKITEEAGVGLGTFYVYFPGKKELFDQVVFDLNRRVRQAMSEASSGATTRLEAERAGFRAFFAFTAAHPALYSIVRQAEFVSPEAMRAHYTSIVDGYISGLLSAQAKGEVRDIDPTVASWALMGAGELIGMRWVQWEQQAGGRPEGVPDHVFEALMSFIETALAPSASVKEESV